MRKSSKCEYTIGVNTKKKRKYLRPEEAVEEANRLNALPHVIKKCIPYKCTTCHFFHVGRTDEDIPRGPLMIPQPEPEELNEAVSVEPVIMKEEKTDNFDWTVKKEIIKEVPIKTKYSDVEHEDFDWEGNKKII